ncbi:MAG: ABC transporter ATP-binding protein [Leptospirales bacterium]|nr:ABC transporter ATP-binding protein [Leptospirales bacterium]
MQHAIEIKGLVKEYRGESETITVLNGLDLSIADRSIASVEGASGEGKSTLLNILGAIDHASGGSVRIFGQELRELGEREKERFRAETVGLIFQHHYLLPDFTVLENAMMPLLIRRSSAVDAKREAQRALELVGLAHRLNHFPNQISGGEMARAGVARALVGGKKLILADEPTGNLDHGNSAKLQNLLWQLQEEMGFTLLIVTHDQELASHVPLRHRLADGMIRPFGN